MPAGPARRARRAAALSPLPLADEHLAIAARAAGKYAASTAKLPSIDRDDLRQEALLAICRWLRERPGEPDPDGSHAGAVAMTAVRDLLKATAARKPVTVRWLEGRRGLVPSDRDAAIDVAAAVAAQPPRSRASLRLYLGGASQAEIAVQAGVSYKAAAARIQAAYARLRPLLDVYADDYRPRKARVSEWHRRGRVRDGRIRDAGPTRGDVARALETLED